MTTRLPACNSPHLIKSHSHQPTFNTSCPGDQNHPTYRRGGGGGTTSWNTAGETASVRNACAQVGLTESDVANADPPIECQWRSCHGNSYAVVKLSDMYALKQRLRVQAAEAKKQALIAELGEEGYKVCDMHQLFVFESR